MPQQMCPYIGLVERIDMLAHYEANDTMAVKNKYGSLCVISSMSDNYAYLKLNSSTTLQLKLFNDSQNNQKLIAVTTMLLPQLSSKVVVFDADWKNESYLFADVPGIEWFLSGDEPMSQDERTEIEKAFFPYLFEARLSAEEDTITLYPIIAFKYDENSQTVDLQAVDIQKKLHPKTFELQQLGI